MVKKEVDKQSQVDEFQMSLVTTVVMSRIGKKWEYVVDQFIVIVKTT
jgi:hypothetical protein